jgi:hypothetical protein
MMFAYRVLKVAGGGHQDLPGPDASLFGTLEEAIKTLREGGSGGYSIVCHALAQPSLNEEWKAEVSNDGRITIVKQSGETLRF